VAAPYEYRCSLCSFDGGCNLACADDLEKMIIRERPETVAAFIAEPVLGTTAAGVVPSPGYYQRIREICDRYNVLFIADEVLVGYGRTGRWLAMDHWRVVPDLITLGKALGGGYAALAAVVASERVVGAIAQGSQKFTHGFTYGGMPISCLVGSEVHRQMRSKGLVEHVAAVGDRMHRGLHGLQLRHDFIGEIRGAGLLAGIEFVEDRRSRRSAPPSNALTATIVAEAFDRGMIVLAGMPGLDRAGGGDHIQLSPPYISSDTDIDLLLEILDDVFSVVATTGEL
jgi:adenosylmethionine-8-amino-7-oxononanoate aminotransferase